MSLIKWTLKKKKKKKKRRRGSVLHYENGKSDNDRTCVDRARK